MFSLSPFILYLSLRLSRFFFVLLRAFAPLSFPLRSFVLYACVALSHLPRFYMFHFTSTRFVFFSPMRPAPLDWIWLKIVQGSHFFLFRGLRLLSNHMMCIWLFSVLIRLDFYLEKSFHSSFWSLFLRPRTQIFFFNMSYEHTSPGIFFQGRRARKRSGEKKKRCK